MLSKALDLSKKTTTDIFFWSMLLSNSSVKWSSADSVEWSFLFPLCRWCMTLFESRKLVNCEWAALSHTLDKISSSDIGLVFAGSSLSPDLRIGTISAFFHGSGKVLKVKESLIRLVIVGAITGELSFRILALTSITSLKNVAFVTLHKLFNLSQCPLDQLRQENAKFPKS